MKALRTRWILAISAAITLGQAAILLAMAPTYPLIPRWKWLIRSDGNFFNSILRLGYVSRFPPAWYPEQGDNVAFFPAYPALAALVRTLTGVSDEVALILAAWLAGLALWTYFLLLCRTWKVPPGRSLLGALFMLSYFGSFYLGVAYAEGLTLAAFAGLVYFTSRYVDGERRAWPIAALHGIILSGSRVSGMALCAYPIFLGLARLLQKGKSRWRETVPLAALSLASLLGAAAFFVYCQWKFGYWDLYFISQRDGWGGTYDLLLPLDPRTYLTGYHLYPQPDLSGAGLGHIAAALLASLFLIAIIWELRAGRRVAGQERRWALYLTGWLSFHPALARAAFLNYAGGYRYGLPLMLCLVLARLDLGKQDNGESRRLVPWVLAAGILGVCVVSLYFQHIVALRFVTGGHNE